MIFILKKKEGNEGDVYHMQEKRAMREIWLSYERKREQWERFDYHRKEKDSNEGDLIIKTLSLSLSLSLRKRSLFSKVMGFAWL